MVLPGFVNAQLDNSFFRDYYSIHPDDSASIKFGIEAFGFFKNNEFKNDIIPGYTLFGYQFRPYFSYFPSGRIRLDAGAFFLKDFGEKNFREIRPLFTIKYSFNHFYILFGTLEGALSHHLIEPIYDFESVIDPRVEDGLQIKYINNRLFLDTWIDWVNMIDFGENALEEFNFGISFNVQLIQRSNFILEIPLQLLANHRGGEIDTSPEPANTLWNTAAGIGLVFPFSEADLLRSIRLDNYYGRFQTSDNSSSLPFNSGDGWFLNVTGDLKWLDLMLSYWHGNQFYAPNGSPLYQSVSFDFSNDSYVEELRDLVFARFLFEHDFHHGLTLAFRFEPVYDLNNNHFDHYEGLYLRYRTDWILNRKKKP
jgi:hypothetical protein